LFLIPIFAGADTITAKQLKFAIQTGAGTLTDPSTSNLVCVELWLLNSAAQ